ncbi:hypothetical protein L4A40_26945 [Bacillus cereus]|uniref:hypothetical protein n=1 Tax=Bacillus cereus TaxID=1396 RepID=UPI001F0FB10F|nr:hypothetical protein [Bacillus cereus]MCH5476725.1 hypothetical protein [Bacillus cereus]
MTLRITDHAIEEMRTELLMDDLLNLTAVTDEEVREYIADYFSKAEYLGVITDINGNSDRLFAYRRYCFVLNIEKDVVITAYRRNVASEELRDIVRPLLFEKLREMESQEKQFEDDYKVADQAYQLERNINSALRKPRHKRGREYYTKNQRRKSYNDMIMFKVEKSKIAKGIALFI